MYPLLTGIKSKRDVRMRMTVRVTMTHSPFLDFDVYSFHVNYSTNEEDRIKLPVSPT